MLSALEALQAHFMNVAYLKAPDTDPDYIDATPINKEPDDQVMGWLYEIWLEQHGNLKADAILPVPNAARKFAPIFSKATGIPNILSTRKLEDGESVPVGAVSYQTESFTHGKLSPVSIIEGLQDGSRVVLLDDVVDDASTFLALMEAIKNSGLNIEVVLLTVIFSKHHNKGGEKVREAGVDFFSAIPVVIENKKMRLVS